MMQLNHNKGTVFNIQKYSIHDGNGIRTLIFMKGCPLRCKWCSNPESQSGAEEIMYIRNNCIQCGKCVDICPRGATIPETYDIDRNLCIACGKCAQNCYANAKKKIGDSYSVSELIDIIEKDRVFYRKSKGGVTIGGGEPLAQPIFVLKLLKECRRLNIHTAIETCGYGEWSEVKGIFKAVDQIFFDIKHMDEQEHIRLTGVSNQKIIENAKNVAKLQSEVVFRIPLVPRCNDSERNIIQTGEFIKSLMTSSNNIAVEILPYHNLGSDKYASLGKAYSLPDVTAPRSEVKYHFNEVLTSIGCRVVK